MVEAIISFILKYKFIILFYCSIIIFLLIKRKQLDIQSKIIVLYRMKWGLRWMDKYSQKLREWIIVTGYIGVGGGFIGLVAISYILIKNLFDLVTKPEITSGVSLVLPGVNVPGLGVLPFWYWLMAIFIIAIVHEFAHGIVARAHNVEVKNTGIVFFGPIIGAFVEPDEKKMRKEKDITQYSILAAGAFSNILLAIIAVTLLNLVFVPLQQTMVEPQGFTFDTYFGKEYPFEKAGIMPGTTITAIDGTPTTDITQLSQTLFCSKPGDVVTIKTHSKTQQITLAESPDNPTKGFMGISTPRNQFTVKDQYQHGFGKVVYYSLEWMNGLGNNGKGFLFWLYVLSFGIGLFNLLPLPIVDGGRMAQVFLHRLKGPEKGELRYRQISIFFVLILLFNLLFPLFGKLW
ncbi:MAG: site-2 protease family protein [Nanoarchaeota archaeon]|nr:site-2 protease family protein [Nanoarchaeota archaeon]